MPANSSTGSTFLFDLSAGVDCAIVCGAILLIGIIFGVAMRKSYLAIRDEQRAKKK